MTKSNKVLVAITFLLTLASSNASFAQMKIAPNHHASSAETLRCEMRELWEDHSMWTRNVILCIVDDLPGKDQAVRRLIQNQTEIGNAFKPFYGEVAGDKLAELYKSHINISLGVIIATKEGNVLSIDEANKRYYANADLISEFLNKQNSYLPLATLITMINDHLKLTTDQAMLRINKNYEGDVLAYDKANDEALMMSDMLVEGIIKQFPARFKVEPIKKSTAKQPGKKL
jgi:hypothetical protein